MKVLFVYKYLTMGGVEAVLRARLDGMPALGFETKVWFLADGEGRELFRGLQPAVQVGGVADLRRFIGSWMPSIVSTIDTEEAFPALQHAGWAGKVILECHTPYAENRAYLRLDAVRRAAAVLVPSHHQRQAIESSLPRHMAVHVVPNPIREVFLRPIAAFEAAPANPIVAWVGRLDRLKNWNAFLEIARLVHRRLAEPEFWILGDGDPDVASALRREATAKGIIQRLRWFQGPSQDYLPSFFDEVRASGGVVVSTSRGESFGMAVAEAMARCCAVVVPRRGPFSEFVDEGVSGLMYEPGIGKRAADQIVRLVTSRDLRDSLGAAAREAILAGHSPGLALRALADALRHVVHTARNGRTMLGVRPAGG
ncbi:MAG: glycosyltransferase family 4 protein [Anaerolineales bacterium]